MVDLDDERGFSVFEAFDQGEFPQRAGAVEGIHRQLPGELDNPSLVPGSGARMRRTCQFRSKCGS